MSNVNVTTGLYVLDAAEQAKLRGHYGPLTGAELEKWHEAQGRFVDDLERLFGEDRYYAAFLHMVGNELAHAIDYADAGMCAIQIVNDSLLLHVVSAAGAAGTADPRVFQLVGMPLSMATEAMPHDPPTPAGVRRASAPLRWLR